MKPFEVGNINVAKTMMNKGSKCIGCHITEKGYLVFHFERNDKTVADYRQSRKEHGLK